MALCLIVDDDSDCRYVNMSICTKLGMKVDVAENGKRALEICEKQMPDLILLDWMMPEMSGVDFLQYLRKMEGGDKVYVLMISAIAEKCSAEFAKEMGADGYLPKPFVPTQLSDRLLNKGLIDSYECILKGMLQVSKDRKAGDVKES